VDEPCDAAASRMSALRRVGLVVHPTRPLGRGLDEIGAWASTYGLTVGQVRIPGAERQVADPIDAAACDLLLALGGDGTALSALHAGAPTSTPVLGIACGSIGVLTSVSAGRVAWALDQITTGRWTPLAIAGLALAWGETHGAVAINDVAVIRDGPGQIMVAIAVDDVLYAEVAGDGVVVATALGSSAYTMAAGGPILAPGADAMAVTPLAIHGGFCPPLVAGNGSRVTLTIEPRHGGGRCEIDGRRTPIAAHVLTVQHRPDYAQLVTFAGEEPRLTGLRRRGLVLDSPRAHVTDVRSGHEVEAKPGRQAPRRGPSQWIGMTARGLSPE
jgi:NAD+ kinase